MVKIIGVNGSPRKAATLHAVKVALAAAEEVPDIVTELIDLSGKKIHPCVHCNRCVMEGLDYCPAFRDDMDPLYEQIKGADGIILASPVYQMGFSATMASFLNRLRPLGKLIVNGHWGTRVGASIAVGGTRNGGQETTLLGLNNAFLSMGLSVTSGGIFAYSGSSVWSNDKKSAGVEADVIGMETLRINGRRVAVIASLLKAGKELLKFDEAVLAGFKDEEGLQERLSKFSSRQEK